MDNDAVYTPAARSFGAPQAPQTVTQTYVHVRASCGERDVPSCPIGPTVGHVRSLRTHLHTRVSYAHASSQPSESW